MGACQLKTMTVQIRELVSKKKRRFVQDGFNLDLTYISDRVIAMGFPATSVEAIYRNSMDEVRRMLEQKHKDHYKLYNLCSERSYDPQKFQNRVAYYPFDDHNPPEFGMMKPFCEDVDKWLNENERNIAVVHCKAGKGRTGLMICAYLLHCRHSLTAEEVLSYYGTARTMDDKGVTIPSQRRYVDYYAAMMNENLQYSPVKLYLYSFVVDPLPTLGLGQQEGYIQFEVRQTRVRPYQSEVYQVKRTDGRINIVLPQPLLIVGDVKIEFIQKRDVFNFGKGKGRFLAQSKLFHFWVNTYFIDLERSSPLCHDISAPSPEEMFQFNFAPPFLRSSALTHESLSARPSLPARPEDRNCRSTHNSGGEVGGDQLPPPRQLREYLIAGQEQLSRSRETADEEEPRSPNGSCLSSMQTIHSHPPARTVSIVEPVQQRHETDCDRGVNKMSISDDTLTEQGVKETTQSSFNSHRKRHVSVPTTSKTGSSHHTRFTRHIPGKLMSVRLKKNQIDGADKDKSSKFSDHFNVTLFLVRPNDQTLQDEFWRSNTICQHADNGGGSDDCGGVGSVEYLSDMESSDDEMVCSHGAEDEPPQDTSAPAGGLRDTAAPGLREATPVEMSHPASAVDLGRGGEGAETAVHGMVRNRTEPGRPLTQLTPLSHSTSTWI